MNTATDSSNCGQCGVQVSWVFSASLFLSAADAHLSATREFLAVAANALTTLAFNGPTTTTQTTAQTLGIIPPLTLRS